MRCGHGGRRRPERLGLGGEVEAAIAVEVDEGAGVPVLDVPLSVFRDHHVALHAREDAGDVVAQAALVQKT